VTKPEELVETALAEVGYKSGVNEDTKYGKWYGLNNNSYPATFVSWCFAKTDCSAAIAVTNVKGFASPKIAYEHFKNNNQVISAWRAKPGDLVFMSYYDSEVNHIGILERVSYTTGFIKVPCALMTIEADVVGELGRSDTPDTVNGVYQRLRPLGDRTRVVGIVRPNWSLTN
jgi:hypothetical protein